MRSMDTNARHNNLRKTWQSGPGELSQLGAATLVSYRPGVFERYTKAYSALEVLPRQQRRSILRRLKTTVSHAAVLYAISALPQTHAATIKVDAGCSLADAINAANMDTVVASCFAGSGLDTIQVGGGSHLGVLPDITSDIILEGGGATINSLRSYSSILRVEDTTIVASSSNGIFAVNGTALSVINSTVSGSTLVASAGIRAYYTDVDVSNSVIDNHDSDGIRVRDGDVTVVNSTISNNGRSGIYAYSPSDDSRSLAIHQSTISGNGRNGVESSTGYGNSLETTPIVISRTSVQGNTRSGVEARNFGSLTISESTISGNTRHGVDAYAGDHDTFGYFDFGSTSITNSTISGNSLDGLSVSGNIAVKSSSFVGNGRSGISHQTLSSTPVVDLQQSIVSGNVGYDVRIDGNLYGSSGVTVFSVDNVLGDNSKTTAQSVNGFLTGGNITATSDGTTPTALSSILNTTLANNGGATETHALVMNSPAVDGTSGGELKDQRGVSRPQGIGFDIGAFEFEYTPTCNGLPATVSLILGESTTPGDDVVVGTNGDDVIRGKAGNDTICGMGGDDFIHGNSGDDWIDGGLGVDNLKGGQGADVLYTGSGTTVGTGSSAFGGYGDDEVYGGPDADVLKGGRGQDLLVGEGGNDEINGNEGDDMIYGINGDDILKGGNGDNDELFGGSGADSLNGGSGNNDTCTDNGDPGDTAVNCEN